MTNHQEKLKEEFKKEFKCTHCDEVLIDNNSVTKISDFFLSRTVPLSAVMECLEKIEGIKEEAIKYPMVGEFGVVLHYNQGYDKALDTAISLLESFNIWKNS